MISLFNTYVYEPILFVLSFIYSNIAFEDFGFAIIILTILIRFILFPIFFKSAKSQTIIQRLQPKVQDIQKKHKENKEEQAKALLSLYKEHKVNPFSGFFLLLLQLPVFFALFRIFSQEASGTMFGAHSLFGLVDLSVANIAIAILAGASQYIQGKLALASQKTDKKGAEQNPMASAGKIMIYISPAITFFVLFRLPAALGLYWLVSTLFSVGQQVYINKKIEKEFE